MGGALVLDGKMGVGATGESTGGVVESGHA